MGINYYWTTQDRRYFHCQGSPPRKKHLFWALHFNDDVSHSFSDGCDLQAMFKKGKGTTDQGVDYFNQSASFASYDVNLDNSCDGYTCK